ncbi:MAG: calcium-binding protein, partial [Tepidisphaeraceae bacterium]
MFDALEPRRLFNAAPFARDLSFSPQGSFYSSQLDSAVPFATQTDGSLLLYTSFVSNTGIRRVTAAGTLDPTYGQAKIASFSGHAAAMDSAQRAIIAGEVHDSTNAYAAVAIRRYTAAGALDTQFHHTGQALLNLPTTIRPGTEQVTVTTVAADSAGRSIVLMSVGTRTFLARLSVHGVLDPTFGNAGYVHVTADAGFTGRSINVLDTGRILITAAGGSSAQVLAYTTRGRVDTTYGHAGRFTLPSLFTGYFKTPPLTAIDSYGSLYVAIPYLTTTGASQPAPVVPDGLVARSVARFRTTGQLDLTFGRGGFALLPAQKPTDFDQINDLQLDAACRIYAAGEDRTVARLLPDGTADSTFDFDGEINDALFHSRLQPTADGSALYQVEQYFGVARYTRPPQFQLDADGTLHINGQQNNARLNIGDAAGKTRIVIDGVTRTFSTTAIKTLDIRLSDGRDIVRADTSRSITLDAGNGGDDVRLSGGGGHIVDLGLGYNRYVGDAGVDEVTSYGGTMNLADGRGRVTGSNIALKADPGSAYLSVSLYGGTNRVNVSTGKVGIAAIDGENHLSLTSPLGAVVVLNGSAGRNFLDTGNGDDTITAGYGHDNIRTFGGNDVISKLAGIGNIDAGDGNDSVRGGAGPETILGGAGNDTLRGNGGNDWIVAGAGNDALFGNGGDDTLLASAGDDTLIGGDGADHLDGGKGAD